jgi:hypothetical protein
MGGLMVLYYVPGAWFPKYTAPNALGPSTKYLNRLICSKIGKQPKRRKKIHDAVLVSVLVFFGTSLNFAHMRIWAVATLVLGGAAVSFPASKLPWVNRRFLVWEHTLHAPIVFLWARSPKKTGQIHSDVFGCQQGQSQCSIGTTEKNHQRPTKNHVFVHHNRQTCSESRGIDREGDRSCASRSRKGTSMQAKQRLENSEWRVTNLFPEQECN